MCEKGSYTDVPVDRLGGVEYIPILDHVGIDSCITDMVLFLNDNGVPTFGSCCGHGSQDGYVQIRNITGEKTFRTMKKWEELYPEWEDRWYVKILCNGVMTVVLLRKAYWDHPGHSKPFRKMKI